MNRSHLRSSIKLSALLSVLVVLGCVDERIVFRDRELFEDPPAGAAGFLGYSDTDAGLVVCGNCHVGQQAEWEETAHADAWATLQNNPNAQAFCEGCHSVNQLGNPAVEAGGYLATPEERYHDVQCESCHGPGLEHVTNPDATQPLASIAVGTELEQGCGECHSGTHQPFVEEWEQSPHATVVTSAAGREACQSCHRGQGVLAAWGVDDNYVEKNSAEHMPITCAVCHDPHDATNAGQLRFPVETASVEEHLCARCHNRRTSPTATSHGLEPHAPETGLLQGDAGWFPPGSNIDQQRIVGTHGSEANRGLCATCHVNSFEITDQATGEFVFNSTGHLFKAIPCVDGQGIPTAEDCGLTVQARSFDGCVDSGCHASEQVARSVLFNTASRIEELAEELHDLLVQVDPNLTGAGGEIDDSNPTFTVAEGAFFNLALAEFPEGERADPLLLFAGSSVHNPFLTETLLRASIQAVRNAYPGQITTKPRVSLEPQLTPPPGR